MKADGNSFPEFILGWTLGQMAVGGSEGTSENSPAFQRREQFGIAKVPQGRLNNRHVLH